MLAEGQPVLSSTVNLTLLRAAEGEFLRCKARVLKPGRKLMVAESEVWCGEGEYERLCAKATVTLSVVE